MKHTMKHKQLLLAILIFLVTLPAFSAAAANERLLSFDWYAADPLYPEAAADPFSSATKLHILSLQNGQPRTIRVEGTNTYDDVPIYNGDKYASETLYAQLKTGVNLGMFRFSLKNILQVEFGFQGALNTVFQGFGGADNLGFDGIFFMGANAKLFDTLAIRYGLKHYSGHYGDETLENVRNNSGNTASPIEYCRDNNLLLGISLPVTSNFRVYADASRPLLKSWLGPGVHIPSWVLKSTSGEPQYLVVSGREGITPVAYPESYKAWIVQTGAEISLPMSFGGLFLAADLKFHQDGQTGHLPGLYQEQNPWEQEYTIGGGIEFDQTGGERKARFEIYYHSGRFPLLNYFYQRSQYIAMGFGVSG